MADELTERLWDMSLNFGHDKETGSTVGYGRWSALFLHERAILHQDSYGNTWVDTYDTKDQAHAAFSQIDDDYSDWLER
jgi:hypothetical protein